MKVKDLMWLAGLLEGEGSFSVNAGIYPRISVRMTDKDVVDRAAGMLGTITTGPFKCKGKESYKPQWTTVINGKHAIGWMMTLYPMMGERRKQRIKYLIAHWRLFSGRTIKVIDRPAFVKWESVVSL